MNVADFLTEASQLDGLQVDIIDQNLTIALRKVIKAFYQLDNSTLARARRSNQGCGFALLEDGAEVVQDFGVGAGRVVKVGVTNFDASFQLVVFGILVVKKDGRFVFDDVKGTLASHLSLNNDFVVLSRHGQVEKTHKNAEKAGHYITSRVDPLLHRIDKTVADKVRPHPKSIAVTVVHCSIK